MRSDHEQRHGSRCDTSGNTALEDSLQVRSRLAVRCLCHRSPPMLEHRPIHRLGPYLLIAHGILSALSAGIPFVESGRATASQKFRQSAIYCVVWSVPRPWAGSHPPRFLGPPTSGVWSRLCSVTWSASLPSQRSSTPRRSASSRLPTLGRCPGRSSAMGVPSRSMPEMPCSPSSALPSPTRTMPSERCCVLWGCRQRSSRWQTRHASAGTSSPAENYDDDGRPSLPAPELPAAPPNCTGLGQRITDRGHRAPAHGVLSLGRRRLGPPGLGPALAVLPELRIESSPFSASDRGRRLGAVPSIDTCPRRGGPPAGEDHCRIGAGAARIAIDSRL